MPVPSSVRLTRTAKMCLLYPVTRCVMGFGIVSMAGTNKDAVRLTQKIIIS